MYISEKNMQGVPKEGLCSSCGKPCKTSTASVQFIHQECYDDSFRKDMRNSILRGIAIFNKYAPNWREKVRPCLPCRPLYFISCIFGGSDEARKSIPELARACSAGRRSMRGRGETLAQESFFSEMGLILYEDDLDQSDLLREMWQEAIEDPNLEKVLPPPHRGHFVKGQRGDAVCFWYGNLIGIPDKRGPQPKDGECWEILDENLSGRVFFLKIGKKIEKEQDIWRHWM